MINREMLSDVARRQVGTLFIIVVDLILVLDFAYLEAKIRLALYELLPFGLEPEGIDLAIGFHLFLITIVALFCIVIAVLDIFRSNVTEMRFANGCYLSLAIWPISLLADYVFFDEPTISYFLFVVMVLLFLAFGWALVSSKASQQIWSGFTASVERGKELGSIGDVPARQRKLDPFSSEPSSATENNAATLGASGNKSRNEKEEQSMPSKTVYVVYIKEGAAGVFKWFEADTMAKAQWAADDQRKRGKEVSIVTEQR